jgi:hypothetical protein
MGAAYYPSFEREIDGFDPSVAISGKPIARAMSQLDEICKRLGAAPLLDFYSESTEEAFKKIGEPVPQGLRASPVSWSEPEKGIRTVTSLIEYLEAHPDELPNTPTLKEDLEGLREVLTKAQKHGTRFRLRIDI